MVSHCLFPVAGYGTRFLPVTKSIPKEMIPVLDKPLVQYGVEEAIQAGLTDIGMVTARGKDAIENHFDVNFELQQLIAGSEKEAMISGVKSLIEAGKFSYTRQTEIKGLGHAILTGQNLVGNNPFGVVLPDDFCVAKIGVLKQMVELFKEHQCSIVAVEEVPAAETHRYGIVTGQAITDDLMRVESMVEKPAAGTAPSNLAIIGRYLLTPDIFDLLRKTPAGTGGEIQITDALLEQAKTGKVLAYRFKGRRFDCGTVPGYVAATNYCYENFYCSP